MKSLQLWSKMLGPCVAAALLAGCAESQSPVAVPWTAPPTAHRSWMLPEARREKLVYASSLVYPYVYVYSMASGKRVGMLSGFTAPSGLCSDATGNVFVVDIGKIQEFAHGGTSPIATLSDSQGEPNGCAVDPSSGDLAAAGGSPHDVEANVYVFPHASGTPAIYQDPNAPAFAWCAYAPDGRLFVNATDDRQVPLALYQLVFGATPHFTQIDVPGQISDAGAIQWLGKYLALGDPHGNQARRGPTTIDLLSISGSSGTVVKTIELPSGKANRNPGTPVEFWISGKRIVNPVRYRRQLAVWTFPKAGHVRTWMKILMPYGVTVSVAPKS
jgi:hypothetical protein